MYLTCHLSARAWNLCTGRQVLTIYSLHLNKLSAWATLNRLTINEKKYVLYRAASKMVPALGLSINNVPFLQSDSYEYLGIALDSRLTSENHINRLLASCNQCIFTLSKIRRYIDEHTATWIHKSFIMSKLNHGGVFYGDARKSLTDRLQKMQNRALQVCMLASRYTSNFWEELANWMGVRDEITEFPEELSKEEFFLCIAGKSQDVSLHYNDRKIPDTDSDWRNS